MSGKHRGGGGGGGGGRGQSRGGGQGRGGNQSYEGGQNRGNGQSRGNEQSRSNGQSRGNGQSRDDNQQRGAGTSGGWEQPRNGGQHRGDRSYDDNQQDGTGTSGGWEQPRNRRQHRGDRSYDDNQQDGTGTSGGWEQPRNRRQHRGDRSYDDNQQDGTGTSGGWEQPRNRRQHRGDNQQRGDGTSGGWEQPRNGGQHRGDRSYDDNQQDGTGTSGGWEQPRNRKQHRSYDDNEQHGAGTSRGWEQPRNGGQHRNDEQRRDQNQEWKHQGGGHRNGQSRGWGQSNGGGQYHQEGQQSSSGYKDGSSQRGQYNGKGSSDPQFRNGPLVVPKDDVTGRKGDPIILETNYLSLNLEKFYKKKIFQHDVNIEPSRFKRLLPKVMEQFRQTHFLNTCFVYDGSKFLLSLTQILECSKEVAFLGEGYNTPLTFNVSIRFIKTIDLGFLQNYRRNPDLRLMTEASQVLSIILRGYPLMRHLSIGRNFYVRPQQTVDLSNGMELVRGLYQAPVLTQRGPLLNVDILNKPHQMAIQPGKSGDGDRDENLLHLICRICNITNIPNNLSEGQIRCILDVIKGKKVTYTLRGVSKDYRINGFRKSPVEEIIPTERMSVETYFAKKKQYKIKYRTLQLLWVGNPNRDIQILIPVELCAFKAGQMTTHNENLPEIVKRIISETISTTRKRKEDIMKMVSEIGNYSNSPFLTEFGIEVGTDFELVKGRILKAPTLQYHGTTCQPWKGVWDARKRKFFKPVVINQWITIVIKDKRNNYESKIKEVTETLQSLAVNHGIKMNAPLHIMYFDQHSSTLLAELKAIFSSHSTCQLFLVVFQEKKLYPLIKQQAELRSGCLTQCLLTYTIQNNNYSMSLSNLLLKINAKCNGINYILSERPAFLHGNVMIMGADVTHPPPGTQSIPSYAAVTASHDLNFFKYNMVAQMQMPTEENIVDLEEITIRQLRLYSVQVGGYPKHIIFFRDGVSEGQFEEIISNEVRAVRRAHDKLSKEKLLITFVVVMKRHHTRLFPTNSDKIYDYKYHNVPAGTVVDTGITHPIETHLKDFYLASHSAIKGVTRPTKYCTIYDDANLNYDNIEELAYYLCHMYTRCTRSVSYPAPTYYAHLAAERGKILCQKTEIDWAQLQHDRKIEIKIKSIKIPMHFV